MAEAKVDMEFVRDSWEDSGHLGDYVDAVDKVGLWDSERLLVSKYFSKEDRILDIGCGAGRTTIALHRLGYRRVQGMDLSRGMIERAISLSQRAGYPIPFEAGDAVSLRYANESFDGALFTAQGFMCIPGRDNRVRALEEVGRVLRPGGHFIFTTHDRVADGRWVPYWEEQEARWKEGRQDPRLLEFGDRILMDSGTWIFVHFPTRDEVEQTVQESGLVLVEDAMRSELSPERDAVRWFSADCRMWVIQRPT